MKMKIKKTESELNQLKKNLENACKKYLQVYGDLIWNGSHQFPFQISEIKSQIEHKDIELYELKRQALKTLELQTWDELELALSD